MKWVYVSPYVLGSHRTTMKPNQAQLFHFAATGALSNLKALAAEGFDLSKEGTLLFTGFSASLMQHYLPLGSGKCRFPCPSVPLNFSHLLLHSRFHFHLKLRSNAT